MFIKLLIFSVLCVLLESAPLKVPELLSDEEEFEKFKLVHSKEYQSPEEEAFRFQIFQDNLKFIRNHNKKYEKGEVSFVLGINKYADLTHEEFKKQFSGGFKRPRH
ncbi:cathepsin L-like proteinase [Sitophilus oryzae]|uniref:Cathepsin L-like proteinase n=1 Tax=Sitophilus oryzae TaxID=7048 RepID=A0A6J2YHG8_SITOR|nr:cathepsin L-like proteinase [Sitophilus oryzae]